jgi:hypothetical protein
MSMTLKDWQNNGWLVTHVTSREEVRDLFGVADRDIHDAGADGLSPDWRLNIAYNAALQLATAALAAEGYRASRDSHHYRVIQSLVMTIGVESKLVAVFDGFRKKRNIGGYERAGMTSRQEADEMVALAIRLRNDLRRWFEEHHPELL